MKAFWCGDEYFWGLGIGVVIRWLGPFRFYLVVVLVVGVVQLVDTWEV